MVGVIDVAVQAANPTMPLYPMRAFVGSSTSLRIRNVPKQVGKWRITNVYVNVRYPDGRLVSVECVQTGNIWVGTVNGSYQPGTSEEGYQVYARGIDENGNEMPQGEIYNLGQGLVEILDADGTITPGETVAYVHLKASEPSTPREGDLYPDNGDYYIWQNNDSHQISGLRSQDIDTTLTQSGKAADAAATGTALSALASSFSQLDSTVSALTSSFNQLDSTVSSLAITVSGKQDALLPSQISAIDSVVQERMTLVKYQNGSTTYFDISGVLNYYDITNYEDMVEIYIGTAVTSIGSMSNLYNLQVVVVPDSVTSIGNRAFYGCESLWKVILPSTPLTIGEQAFENCYLLYDFNIPDGVMSIGARTFAIDYRMEKVVVGSGVSTLASDAFTGCTSLTEIVFKNRSSIPSGSPWGAVNASVTTWNDASEEWVSALVASQIGTVLSTSF